MSDEPTIRGAYRVNLEIKAKGLGYKPARDGHAAHFVAYVNVNGSEAQVTIPFQDLIELVTRQKEAHDAVAKAIQTSA